MKLTKEQKNLLTQIVSSNVTDADFFAVTNDFSMLKEVLLSLPVEEILNRFGVSVEILIYGRQGEDGDDIEQEVIKFSTPDTETINIYDEGTEGYDVDIFSRRGV
jgi:hypothetical protein